MRKSSRSNGLGSAGLESFSVPLAFWGMLIWKDLSAEGGSLEGCRSEGSPQGG